MVVEIQFGVGGTDSKLFVHDLAAAYIKYATNLNLKSEFLQTSDGHVLIKFKGKNVWDAFKDEGGKHVVQRIPPTEKAGRKQTSIISVAVLELRPKGEYKPLLDKDLEIITQGGHGKGGQHQNATDSAVRMKHVPTGITVFINGRDQHTNKREALDVLTARVNEKENSEKQTEYSKKRREMMGSGERGAKIRTYNFLKGFATDHRSNKKTGNLKAVFDKGKFDLLK